MRKIFISLTTSFFIITIIFLSCKKNETTYRPENEAFIEQTKNWFNSSFVNTEEYKNGTTNGNFKKPNWNLGIIYYIGKTQVAEFPLITGRKKVYISETLSESDSRKIIDNTIFKVLFVKAPNKPMEVRIIQFTPTLNYLKSKNFDLSNLSFKDYTKEFKGDFMMFDFDNNFKKGYHFANDGIKTIKLQTKFLNKNNTANVPRLDVTTTSSSDLCDNSIEIESNCWYNVHITYETICTGGWNLDEGFNPNYCHIEIVSIYCELAYCDNTIDFENCLNQGNTQEQCLCILYEIDCGGSGDDAPDPCTDAQPSATATTTLSQTSTYTIAKNNIQNATSNAEHSIVFGIDANGTNASPMLSCPAGAPQCSVNVNWPGAFADLHNHPDVLPPSPADMYNLIGVNNNHSGYNTRMVVTIDGSVFALVVLDLAAANTFKSKFAPVNIGYGPDFPSEIYVKFDQVKDQFTLQGLSTQIAEERAMAYVLDKYNTGIALLKQDSNGNFKRLKTDENTSNGNTTFTANNCQ